MSPSNINSKKDNLFKVLANDSRRWTRHVLTPAKSSQVSVLVLVFLFLCPSNYSLGSLVVQVDAKCDLSNAGRAEIRTPYPSDAVLLPVGVYLPTGTNRWIEFSNVTGIVNAGYSFPDVGPDGGTEHLLPDGYIRGTNIFSYNGVSGIVANRFLFLAGAFLTDDQPVEGQAPDRLDFRVIGTDFSELSPLINQSFFIGDGRTSLGLTQRFFVPDNATRLYLGFLDSFNFGWTQGGDLPYAYWDNTGSLTAELSINAVPEPSTFLLLSIPGSLICLFRPSRRSAET